MNKIKPNKINFKSIKITEVLFFVPAGNDVTKCIIEYNNCLIDAFIKIERSKMADFASEIKNLNLINNEGLYNKTPLIYESGIIKNRYYLVLESLPGRRLTEVFKRIIKYKNNYLFRYGKELAVIHTINPEDFEIAKQRSINDIPEKDLYSLKEVKKYIKYLEANRPDINYDTFIHGDFHYGNILWKNGKISGVIDWEYSGKGFKEQDIAWALILRLNQRFMTSIKDIKMFLKGYKTIGSYNREYLRWCLINGCLHFYLMSKNKAYKTKLIKIMDQIMAE